MNSSNGYGGMGGGMGGGGAGGMMNGTMNGMNSMGSGMMMNNGGGNSMNGGGNGMMSNSYSGGSLSAAGRGAPMGEVDDGEEAVVYQIVYGKPGSMGLDMRPHSLEYSLQSGQKGDCRALLSDPDPLKHPSLDLLPTHPLLCPLTHPLNLPSHTLSIYPPPPSQSTSTPSEGAHVPLVVSGPAGSPIKPGDIMVSINGKPLIADANESPGGAAYLDIVKAMIGR